jgi:hypothetical protein
LATASPTLPALRQVDVAVGAVDISVAFDLPDHPSATRGRAQDQVSVLEDVTRSYAGRMVVSAPWPVAWRRCLCCSVVRPALESVQGSDELARGRADR